MKTLKKQIEKLKKEVKYSIDGLLTSEKDSEDFWYDEIDKLNKRIINLSLLDTSNDGNYCMPDGINSKEEHDEYLKAIGYEKYVKDLEHFKDTHVGLYVIDKMIDDIFTETPDEKDCKTVVEAYLVQQYKRLKSLVWRIS